MKTPAAIAKADSLLAHAKHCGCGTGEFQVALTLGEGYELLDYLVSTSGVANRKLLKADVEEAKVAGDPWLVLKDWKLHGFEVVRVESLH
ncbi:MAG TPA: hypothetical protein VMU47_06660 [Caldimonas sp.]|nr:hypothetical protein [Caldimonas sp.]